MILQTKSVSSRPMRAFRSNDIGNDFMDSYDGWTSVIQNLFHHPISRPIRNGKP